MPRLYVGPRIVLVSRNPSTINALEKAFGSDVIASASWGHTPGHHLVVVDTSCLSASDWRDLVVFSRLTKRPRILLVGHESDPLGFLAKTAAEDYVVWQGVTPELEAAVRAQLGDRRVEQVGASIAHALAAPPQLTRFITMVFAAVPPYRHVKRAACAAGCKETTLRYQLRRCGGREIDLKGIIRVALITRFESDPAERRVGLSHYSRKWQLDFVAGESMLDLPEPRAGIQ